MAELPGIEIWSWKIWGVTPNVDFKVDGFQSSCRFCRSVMQPHTVSAKSSNTILVMAI